MTSKSQTGSNDKGSKGKEQPMAGNNSDQRNGMREPGQQHGGNASSNQKDGRSQQKAGYADYGDKQNDQSSHSRGSASDWKRDDTAQQGSSQPGKKGQAGKDQKLQDDLNESDADT